LPTSLTHWKRALALGFLSWLLPFLLSFLAFPLKKANAPLFATVMFLILILVAAPLRDRYFRDIGAPQAGEAALLGFLWLAINLAMDYPMFAYGPMKMTAAHYYSEIGAAYLVYPAFLTLSVRTVFRRPQSL
jgi:hypothetical protein